MPEVDDDGRNDAGGYRRAPPPPPPDPDDPATVPPLPHTPPPRIPRALSPAEQQRAREALARARHALEHTAPHDDPDTMDP